ncbi:MAG TPA: hypothetical protein VGF56_09075 [Rhizomicrobium sp.]
MSGRLLTALLLCAVAPAFADGGDGLYRDDAHGFEILQPAGWAIKLDASLAGHYRVSVNAPSYAGTGEGCSITVIDTPSAPFTQEQLNASVQHGDILTAQSQQLKQMGIDFTITSQSIVTLSGFPAQESTQRIHSLTPKGKAFTGIVHDFALLVPGHEYLIDCGTLEDAYAAAQPEMDRVARSFQLIAPR